MARSQANTKPADTQMLLPCFVVFLVTYLVGSEFFDSLVIFPLSCFFCVQPEYIEKFFETYLKEKNFSKISRFLEKRRDFSKKVEISRKKRDFSPQNEKFLDLVSSRHFISRLVSSRHLFSTSRLDLVSPLFFCVSTFLVSPI